MNLAIKLCLFYWSCPSCWGAGAPGVEQNCHDHDHEDGVEPDGKVTSYCLAYISFSDTILFLAMAYKDIVDRSNWFLSEINGKNEKTVLVSKAD